jgi:hypothetical protein
LGSDPEQVFPKIVDPTRCFVTVMPILRRISGRIQIPESVGLGINNRDFITRSFIERVALRGDREPEYLSTKRMKACVGTYNLPDQSSNLRYGVRAESPAYPRSCPWL